MFYFREWRICSARSSVKKFNIIFSSLLLTLCVFILAAGRAWRGWHEEKCFAVNEKQKKRFQIKLSVFHRREFEFFFCSPKPIMKIKQKTCLFSSNINRSFFSRWIHFILYTLIHHSSAFFFENHFYSFLILHLKRKANDCHNWPVRVWSTSSPKRTRKFFNFRIILTNAFISISA